MQKSLSWARFFMLLILMFGTSSVNANPSEIQVRLGGVFASYSGPIEGKVTIPSAIDVDYGLFVSTRKSVNFRGVLAMEFPSAKPYYMFAGAGMRFFFGSSAMPMNASDGGVSISIESPWRYYTGFDLGVSQVIVQSFGRVLQATSTMLDLSGNAGLMYQVDRNTGISAQFSVGMGYGFSSVAVYATTARLLLGASYLF